MGFFKNGFLQTGIVLRIKKCCLKCFHLPVRGYDCLQYQMSIQFYCNKKLKTNLCHLLSMWPEMYSIIEKEIRGQEC